ncbi:dihydroxy-acid dehydratase family protein [Exilibacterium tricleocarpae]|uniref:Dihydroxy-acid dehydratase family protein n=1 Tax=Exilibacterium tricleocarpae TaxID=2591008 RepID=A0A545TS95_9GAMM|nr:IlvD/Edd family dehydratase [Exilibacterium tricleocarpae]TQV80098.1 dihydroxy-acid dehydratase family protein [Exilibacterium tricleocarpae]
MRKPDSKPRSLLRSEQWFNNLARADQTAIYVERYLNYGLTREELQSGRPIIGIAQSGSDLAPCNRHHVQLAERVKAGIRDAGGVPFEFPVHAIHEMGKRPTAALDRNLCYLGLVEILYGYPLDGVVLTTGCDKTTPSQLMAAALVDIPTIVLSGGPMLNGWIDGRRSGSGAMIWQSREAYAAGTIDYDQFMENVISSVPSIGHCNTMGTALTMNCLAEAMGMSLPGCAAIPAPYRQRAEIAYNTGRRIVAAVGADLTPSAIMTRAAFVNAIRVCTALGGSTNAPIHLQAIAAQLDIELDIQDWQDYGEAVPRLVDCQPAGDYLGEDFYRAGGVPAVIGELLRGDLFDGETQTVSGIKMSELHRGCRSRDTRVIASADQPFQSDAGFAVMKGNLFRSALLKKSVISPEFRQRYLSDPDSPECFTARAIVFEGPEDYHRRINDPALEIDKHCVLVMRYCGPLAYPGSAEVVNMLPPDHLVQEGITSLPCIGDGRQSGTSASPSILNAAPEAAAGGGLALLQTNDPVRIDLANNTVDVLVDEATLTARARALKIPALENQTPWQEIYRDTVNQLDEGGVMRLKSHYRSLHKTKGIPRHSH